MGGAGGRARRSGNRQLVAPHRGRVGGQPGRARRGLARLDRRRPIRAIAAGSPALSATRQYARGRPAQPLVTGHRRSQRPRYPGDDRAIHAGRCRRPAVGRGQQTRHSPRGARRLSGGDDRPCCPACATPGRRSHALAGDGQRLGGSAIPRRRAGAPARRRRAGFAPPSERLDRPHGRC